MTTLGHGSPQLKTLLKEKRSAATLLVSVLCLRRHNLLQNTVEPAAIVVGETLSKSAQYGKYLGRPIRFTRQRRFRLFQDQIGVEVREQFDRRFDVVERICGVHASEREAFRALSTSAIKLPGSVPIALTTQDCGSVNTFSLLTADVCASPLC